MWTSILAIACSLLSGCSDLLPNTDSFGEVKGTQAVRSVNGLGIHKKMWQTAGAKCLTPQKLSPRLESFDTIVLVGQSFEPPGKAAREWLEDWLGRESNRTVVYFGRDFNADIFYRERSLELLPETKQRDGARSLALSESRELDRKLRSIGESTFCEWFYLDTTQPAIEHSQFTGPWASELPEGRWRTQVQLASPSKDWQTVKPSWLKKKTAANPMQPASSFEPSVVGGSVQRSEWRENELETKEDWDDAFLDLPTSETLLASSDGQPLVFRLEHEARYADSQILIVVNGAPLLNASLVDPFFRSVGSRLIEECLPAKRVALIAYNERGLLISEAAETSSRGVGLEVLNVWPLSAITMPAALLGIVLCASLLPILGRARSLARRSTTDFGLHVEAIGQMLADTRDTDYARKIISEYFEKVRGETPPAWLKTLNSHTITGPAKIDSKPAQANSQTIAPPQVHQDNPSATTQSDTGQPQPGLPQTDASGSQQKTQADPPQIQSPKSDT